MQLHTTMTFKNPDLNTAQVLLQGDKAKITPVFLMWHVSNNNSYLANLTSQYPVLCFSYAQVFFILRSDLLTAAEVEDFTTLTMTVSVNFMLHVSECISLVLFYCCVVLIFTLCIQN